MHFRDYLDIFGKHLAFKRTSAASICLLTIYTQIIVFIKYRWPLNNGFELHRNTYMCIFFSVNMINYFLFRNICFSLAYFLIRIQDVIHMKYVNWLYVISKASSPPHRLLAAEPLGASKGTGASSRVQSSWHYCPHHTVPGSTVSLA